MTPSVNVDCLPEISSEKMLRTAASSWSAGALASQQELRKVLEYHGSVSEHIHPEHFNHLLLQVRYPALLSLQS